MFRESAKTSLAKGFLIYCICNRKFEYINVDSHDKANSERFLFDVVLELQTNAKIKRDFGELFNAKRTDDAKTQKKVSDFLTTNGVRVEAHSTQEPVRGRLHGSTRPQLVIMDDFEDLTTVRSEAATRQVRDHISEFKGGLDQEHGRILYLGNYLSEAGTVQSIIDKAKTDESMRVRTVWIVDEWGNPTWKERHVLTDDEVTDGKISIEEIKRRMRTPESGDANFMREMMGKPFDPSLAKFIRSMFREVSRDEVDQKETANYLLIDPPGQAYTEASIRKGEGDFIGYSLVKVSFDGRWYVESWRARHTPKELLDNMFSIWRNESIIEIGIEDTQFYQGLKTLIEEEEQRRGIRLNIKELRHTSKASKGDRILSLLPRYEQGQIWHVRGKCNDLETELLRFPISEHDDACLIGSTLILTEFGEIPIENIKAGMSVMTRLGWKKVTCARCTGSKEVVKNIGIIGTKDHKIITKNGKKALQDIGVSDILYTWNKELLSIEKKSIIDTQILNDHTLGIIFGIMVNGKLAQYHFIDKSGLITSEKYQQACLYITRMVIFSIMNQVILSASLLKNMLQGILKSLRRQCLHTESVKIERGILQQQEMRRDYGTKALKDGLGTRNMLERWDSEKRKVYNLTVEDAHEFFANGILVSNCDSLAMANEVVERPREKTNQVHVSASTSTAYRYGSNRNSAIRNAQ
jgi:phage terminase large subunit-like protein